MRPTNEAQVLQQELRTRSWGTLPLPSLLYLVLVQRKGAQVQGHSHYHLRSRLPKGWAPMTGALVTGLVSKLIANLWGEKKRNPGHEWQSQWLSCGMFIAEGNYSVAWEGSELGCLNKSQTGHYPRNEGADTAVRALHKLVLHGTFCLMSALVCWPKFLVMFLSSAIRVFCFCLFPNIWVTLALRF